MLTDNVGAHAARDREKDDLHRLIRDQGLKRYGVFFITGEGIRLPDGSEDASGYVIDDHGRVFSFWLDWDYDRQGVTFTEWEQVEPEPEWNEDAEYRQAREAAGLAA